jgi:PST family polysaccharide transporter
MILSRILTPSDFAIIVLANIVINFFSVVSTVGIGPAIIQNKTLSDKNIEDIFSFTLYLALILSAIYIFFIPLLVEFYGRNRLLENIFYLLSFNVFFALVTIVPNALILKQKKFQFLALRTIFIHIITGVISILTALKGLGIYALLITPIFGSILLFTTSYIYVPVKIRCDFSIVSIKKILSFSFYQILFNIVYILYRAIDKILIGRYFSMDILGYYEKSYRLMMLPLENVSNVINPVLHPILSDYQNEKKIILNAYSKMITLLAYLGFSLSVFIFFTSSELIVLIFGEQWLPSVPVFKILSLSIGPQIIQSPIGAVFQAINQVKSLFYASIIVMITTILAVIIGIYQHSVEKLALYLVLTMFVANFIYNIYLCRHLKCKLLFIFTLLFKPLFYTIVLASIFYIYSILCPIKAIFFSFSIKGLIFMLYMLICVYAGCFDELPAAKRISVFIKRIC